MSIVSKAGFDREQVYSVARRPERVFPSPQGPSGAWLVEVSTSPGSTSPGSFSAGHDSQEQLLSNYTPALL